MTKRVLSLLIAACLMLLPGVLPAAAHAAGTFQFYAEGGPNDTPLSNGTVNYSDTLPFYIGRCIILCGFDNDTQIAAAVASRDGAKVESVADATAFGRGMFIAVGDNPGPGASFVITVTGLPDGAGDVSITVLGDSGGTPSAGGDAPSTGEETTLYALDAESSGGAWTMLPNGPGAGMNTFKCGIPDERVFFFRLGRYAPENGNTGSGITTALESSDPDTVAVEALDQSAGLWKLTIKKATGEADVTTEIGGTVYTFHVRLLGDETPAPQITLQPESTSVAAGKTAVFTAAASDAESYQWYYRTSSSGSWTKVKTNGTSATYRLTTAARHNGYEYCCEASNPAGSVRSHTATLTVTAKPTITTQPKDVTVTAGKTARFTIAADGADSFQWQYKAPGGTWKSVSAASGKTAN